jgi:rSAM/selenodomain-associated transferase 2
VVPVLNEAAGVRAALEALAPLRARGHEVIVADGGSRDGSAELARGLCDRLLDCAPGRALVFLHADTALPPDAPGAIAQAMKNHVWGRFDVEIEGRHPLLKIIAWSMNLRSRLTGIATGDQAIFVRRDAFPGFAEIPLMEDVAFSTAMKRRGAPACLRSRVRTSGRRWETRGVLRTVLLMWHLRLAYALGADPARLAEKYR